MRIINRKVEVALNALQALHRAYPNRLLRSELAKALGESDVFLNSVLTTLSQNGYVEGTRGPIGGYTINKQAANKNFFDLLECFGVYYEENPTRKESASEQLVRRVRNSVEIPLKSIF